MSTEKKNDDHLNDLLEDALDDLLLDDDKEIPEQECRKDEPNATTKEKEAPKAKEFGQVEEEEMNKFFENMAAKLKEELPDFDPKEAQAKINESVPQIFDLMQNLLSKQLLYPALKDLSPKFDEWLKNNSPSLSKTDKKRYRKQKEIIDEIIYVFDDETLDDKERFEKNLDLMEKMQTLGSPPKELSVPEGMNKCAVM